MTTKKVELPHQLSLKVMRLAKPSFPSLLPMVLEEDDIPFNFKGSVNGSENALKLSAAFGEIYLGETFTCYLTLQNSSDEVVTGVVIKAELQTASKRYVLHNTEAAPIAQLGPDTCDDCVLKRVIRDEGVHILVCTASYQTATMGRRSFRKFFKFNVTQPFTMAHRQLLCPNSNNNNNEADADRPLDVLLETDLENSTPFTLCVTNIRMANNAPSFVLVADQCHPEQKVSYVPPSCCVQYVHRLRPVRSEENGAYPPAQSALGYLELSWSRGWGDSGTILSPPLYYTPPQRGTLEAELVNGTPTLTIGKPATVACKIRNTHHYDAFNVKVKIVNAPNTPILITGNAAFDIPPLLPRQHATIDLTLLPLKSGTHFLGGLQLEAGEEVFVFDQLGTCVVEM